MRGPGRPAIREGNLGGSGGDMGVYQKAPPSAGDTWPRQRRDRAGARSVGKAYVTVRSTASYPCLRPVDASEDRAPFSSPLADYCRRLVGRGPVDSRISG